jgi:hypothetical protein
MNERESFKGSDVYLFNIARLKELLGFSLAYFFFHPGQFNLIIDLEFIFQNHSSPPSISAAGRF